MKYLKLFENSEIDTQLVKDIIIEIKDEYTSIDGEISKNDDGLEIKLDCSKIFRYYTHKGEKDINPHGLEYIERKNKFISLIIEISKRLEDALDYTVKVLNLFDFDTKIGSIKIFLIK